MVRDSSSWYASSSSVRSWVGASSPCRSVTRLLGASTLIGSSCPIRVPPWVSPRTDVPVCAHAAARLVYLHDKASPAIEPLARARPSPLVIASRWTRSRARRYGCIESSWTRRSGATRRPSTPSPALVGDRCMAIACRILRDFDLAEDAVQSALVTAWRELRTLRDPDRFEPWLHRILTHECYAEARRRTSMVGEHPAPSGRRTGRARRVPDRQRSRPARARLPEAHRSSSGPCSSSTTTSGSRCPRWRIESASRSGPRSPACTTRRRRSGRASRPTRGRPRHPRSDPHDRAPRSRPPDQRLPRGGPDGAAGSGVRRGPSTTSNRHDNGSSSARGGFLT